MQRLEAKRVEHERARSAQRAKFEQEMRLLEEKQKAEESLLTGEETASPANGDGASIPTTPLDGQDDKSVTEPNANGAGAHGSAGAIGQGRELANGAKSMPASRRASGYGTFGMEKLSLSVMDEGTGRVKWDEEDVDDQGAHSMYSTTSRKLLSLTTV